MSIIIFLIILAILIFVHELGHFIAAKKTGMRVDEFAIGFRPKIWGKKKGETEFFFGLIPIGGYVKIFGEDSFNSEDDLSEKDKRDLPRAFSRRPLWAQAIVLVAGVTFNILFAWFLISVNFMTGATVLVSDFPNSDIENKRVEILNVLPNSPAEKAGLKPGNVILTLESNGEDVVNPKPEQIVDFVGKSEGNINIEYLEVNKKGINSSFITLEKEKITELNVEKEIIGITTDFVGEVKMAPHKAIFNGLKATYVYMVLITEGTLGFFKDVFLIKADIDQVSGPVGMVALAGDAIDSGFSRILLFTALISLSLAIINILPFPALDGGRLIFVIIESIIKRPISPKIANSINFAGFSFLILLMIVITFNDVLKIFG